MKEHLHPLFCYRERNRIIRAMGYSSYKEYLASDLWKSIREKVLYGSPPCYVCGDKADQVHHGKYRKKDLEGRDLSFLSPICSRCHKNIEFRNRDGEKLSVKQATRKMKQIANKNRIPNGGLY